MLHNQPVVKCWIDRLFFFHTKETIVIPINLSAISDSNDRLGFLKLLFTCGVVCPIINNAFKKNWLRQRHASNNNLWRLSFINAHLYNLTRLVVCYISKCWTSFTFPVLFWLVFHDFCGLWWKFIFCLEKLLLWFGNPVLWLIWLAIKIWPLHWHLTHQITV